MTQQFPPSLRDALSRVIAVINGKGGVGKTSWTAAVAALLAAAGERVLIVDLDKQGNIGDDLGYNAVGMSDAGLALSNAVQFGRPPLILHDVRPNLDVMPGGRQGQDFPRRYLVELSGALAARAGDGEHGRASAILALAHMLAPIAPDYSVVLIDCPPMLEPLQRAGLGAAHYAIVPTKTDKSSLEGLAEVHSLFREVRSYNPTLELLGVVLFGITSAAKIARAQATEWIQAAMGEDAPIFKPTVRHTEAVAEIVRRHGQPPGELVLGPETGTSATTARAAAGLAKDYAAMRKEMIIRMMALEAAVAADANGPEVGADAP